MSTSFEARKGKELLKPPEVKPTLTIMLMLCCAFSTGKGDIKWLFDHSISGEIMATALATTKPATTLAAITSRPAPVNSSAPPPAANQSDGIVYVLESFFSGKLPRLSRIFPYNPIATATEVAWTSATGQITIWILLVNVLYIWLFGSQVESKYYQKGRFFIFLGGVALIPAAILYLTTPAGTNAYLQKIVGPTLMTCFMLGGYFLYLPKKPWKPAEWKPPRWKVFKGNDEKQRTMVKVPWVNPWVYVFGFFIWTGLQQAMFTFSRQDLVNATHQIWLGDLYSTLTGGTVSGGTIAVVAPIPAVLSILAGGIFAYLCQSLMTTVKYKRQASDLQVQAVLQYKELRSLDMNHNQAIEGTSKLIGVPLDICRDWINKGLQPIKEEN
jgi:hypothetical protein